MATKLLKTSRFLLAVYASAFLVSLSSAEIDDHQKWYLKSINAEQSFRPMRLERADDQKDEGASISALLNSLRSRRRNHGSYFEKLRLVEDDLNALAYMDKAEETLKELQLNLLKLKGQFQTNLNHLRNNHRGFRRRMNKLELVPSGSEVFDFADTM